MFAENKFFVYNTNKILYHAVLFGSFFIAIKLIPFVEKQIIKYVPQIQNNFIQLGLTYLIVYVGAIYILPEIGFTILKSTMKD